jgi:hypothetical protein
LALSRELAAFEELKLLPLDKESARQLVAAEGVDGTAFVDALVAAGLGRLSASPQQLRRLARYWDYNDRLPESQLEAIEWEVGRLLEETDDGRPQRLPRDRAVRTAERLGVFAAFSGVHLLATGTHDDPGVVGVADLPSDPEPDQPGIVSPQDYGDVVGTALFDAGASGTVMFRHQQYAEYLAAAYLVRRGVSEVQVPALLGVHSNGLLPTERIGVAAWLAALRPALVKDLLAANAPMFASSPVELPSDRARAALVGGLLDAAADDVGPDWGVDVGALAHIGLVDILEARLVGGPATSSQLWWIARLAAAGGCRRLCTLLVAAARTSSWSAFARRAAVSAVADLGDENDRRALRDLLDRPPADDPDDEILAALIDALYPGIVSAEELTRALRPRQSLVLYGHYMMTLEALADRIPEEDLPVFLAWGAARGKDFANDRRYGRLFTGLVRRGWEGVDSGPVRAALAAFVTQAGRAGRWVTQETRLEPLPWSEGDTARRRRLALAAADALAGEAWYVLLFLRLLVPEDAEWLVDELPTRPADTAAVLAQCLARLVERPTAGLADRILSMAPSHPAYEVTRWFRESVDRRSESVAPMARAAAEEYSYQREQAQIADRVRSDLDSALRRVETDIESWSRIAHLLAFDEHNDPGPHAVTYDLTQRPGWATLTPEDRQLVLRTGVAYVSSHQPTAGTWSGSKTVSPDQVLADWSGVFLMATLACHAPRQLAELELGVWERWAPAIVAAWDGGRGGDSDLRLQLIDAAPRPGREHIVRAALDHLDVLDASDRDLLPPYAVYAHLVDDLASDMARRLVAGHYSSGLRIRLLELLARNAPGTALPVCRALAVGADAPVAAHAVRHLAALDPNGTVDEWAADLPPPTELAALAGHLRIAGLGHARLTTAARVLLDAFPYDSDPEPESGWGVEHTGAARSARGEALRRLADLGACEEIASLRTGRPPLDELVLRRYERTARIRQADLSIAATRPRDLLELLRSRDARMVRDDDDLLSVVVEQLDILQHQITYNGAFRDLWDGAVPKCEDDISDWIRRNLEMRFDGNLVVDREVQVLRRGQRGSGTRIDLTATAPTSTQPPSTARMAIEAKLVDNDELMNAMHGQLIHRYLVPADLTHGMYLVYWITPEQRPDGWSHTKARTIHQLREELDDQARRAPQDLRIRPYILDLSRPHG